LHYYSSLIHFANKNLSVSPAYQAAKFYRHAWLIHLYTKWFKLGQYKDSSIILADLANLFCKCNVAKYFKKISRYSKDSLRLGNVFVFAFRKKEIYEVELFDKNTHAYGWLTFKRNRSKFFSVKSNFGILD